MDRYDAMAIVGLLMLTVALYLTWGTVAPLAFVGVVLLLVGVFGAKNSWGSGK